MKDQHYEEAKKYFVIDGFKIDTIATLMTGKVSRRTLYNWRNENGWDKEREFQLKRTTNLRDDIYSLAEQTVREAKQNPTPNNIFAVGKMIGILKNMTVINAMETPEEEEKNDGTISTETIAKIEQLLGIDLGKKAKS
jgi:hypothetical protein